MMAAGVASTEDVARWEKALERMDHSTVRPTVFAPNFIAIGLKEP
jgi:hypothetical protein